MKQEDEWANEEEEPKQIEQEEGNMQDHKIWHKKHRKTRYDRSDTDSFFCEMFCFSIIFIWSN